MEAPKISFGFSKVVKKPQLVPNSTYAEKAKNESKIELIDCLEGQTIKIVGKDENEKDNLLVIPSQSNTTPLEKIKNLQNSIGQTLCNGNSINPINEGNPNESLEQRAAREIMEGLKEAEEEENRVLTVKLNSDEIPLDGAKESNMDDYDRVPIQQFGLALLRGMGWKDEDQKEKKKKIGDDIIVCRPKGLGLGADKVIKKPAKKEVDSKGEVLIIKKGAYVKILGGKYVDMYGQVEGMDEESGRIFVKFALGGNRENVNENFIEPVSEKEYMQNRKVINVSKYEEYKRMQDDNGVKKKHSSKDDAKKEESVRRDQSHKQRNRRDSIDSDERRDDRRRGEEKRRDRDRYRESRRRDYSSSSEDEEERRRRDYRNHHHRDDRHYHKSKSYQGSGSSRRDRR